MYFTAALVGLLSATTVLAAPGPRKIQPRGVDLKSEKGASSSSSKGDDSVWFGVALKAPAGVKFTSISATIKVPSFKLGDQPQYGDTDGIAAWIGIDGLYGSSEDVLQGGIVLALNHEGAKLTVPDGKTFIVNAVEEWYPTGPHQLTQAEFPLRIGHTLHLRIDVTSETTGTLTFENADTKQRLVRPLTAPAGTRSLQNSAEWIVESLINSKTGLAMPPPDFGTLTFADCVATGSDGKTYGPGTGIVKQEAYKLQTSRTDNSVSVRFVSEVEAGDVPPPANGGNGGRTGTA